VLGKEDYYEPTRAIYQYKRMECRASFLAKISPRCPTSVPMTRDCKGVEMAAATIQSFVDEIATKANIHPEAAETAVGTILFVAKGGQHHQGGSTFSTIARRNYAGLSRRDSSMRFTRQP
jgi:hypothetical protein